MAGRKRNTAAAAPVDTAAEIHEDAAPVIVSEESDTRPPEPIAFGFSIAEFMAAIACFPISFVLSIPVIFGLFYDFKSDTYEDAFSYAILNGFFMTFLFGLIVRYVIRPPRLIQVSVRIANILRMTIIVVCVLACFMWMAAECAVWYIVPAYTEWYTTMFNIAAKKILLFGLGSVMITIAVCIVFLIGFFIFECIFPPAPASAQEKKKE